VLRDLPDHDGRDLHSDLRIPGQPALIARVTFQGNAAATAILSASIGVGAVVGGLIKAAAKQRLRAWCGGAAVRCDGSGRIPDARCSPDRSGVGWRSASLFHHFTATGTPPCADEHTRDARPGSCRCGHCLPRLHYDRRADHRHQSASTSARNGPWLPAAWRAGRWRLWRVGACAGGLECRPDRSRRPVRFWSSRYFMINGRYVRTGISITTLKPLAGLSFRETPTSTCAAPPQPGPRRFQPQPLRVGRSRWSM